MNEPKQFDVDEFKRTVAFDGKVYDFPVQAKGKNVFMVGEEIYVDGFQLTKGKWKRTFSAWHNNIKVSMHKQLLDR